jgi:hypothetical protein
LRVPSLLGEAKNQGVIAGGDFGFDVSVGNRKEKHGWDENQDYAKGDPSCGTQLNSPERIQSKMTIYQIFQQFATMRKTWCIIIGGQERRFSLLNILIIPLVISSLLAQFPWSPQPEPPKEKPPVEGWE